MQLIVQKKAACYDHNERCQKDAPVSDLTAAALQPLLRITFRQLPSRRKCTLLNLQLFLLVLIHI